MPRALGRCWIFALCGLLGCSSDPVQNRRHLEVQAPIETPAPIAKRLPPPKAPEPLKTTALADTASLPLLLKADSQIKAGDFMAAQKSLDLLLPAQLSPEQRSQFHLLAAQVSLSTGDAERAMSQLEAVRPKLLAQDDQLDFYQSLAFGHALLGNVLPGVAARIRLGSLLQKPDQQQANVMAILDMLSLLPLETLNAPPALVDELDGWVSLAKLLKQRQDSGLDVSQAIMQWRQSNPHHPANAEFLQQFLTAPQLATELASTAPAESAATGPMVAVLLPASGTYAQAAKVIKDGLQAAHRVAASSAPQPRLQFYDTEQADIVAVYKQAVAEGAQQIIGPLVKEQIQVLALRVPLTVQVLALNHVDNLSKPQLYQFGLSPLDEAQQLASKARRDGRETAMVLVPGNAQGQRISQYLTAAWQAQGGKVLATQSYDPKQHDVGTVLSGLLASNAALQPQTVLISATPDVGREVAPQLKYHAQSPLAVYAMPSIYAGHPNPAQDAELGSIRFCDMPWLFPEWYSGALSQSALQASWQHVPDHLVRLVALGVDAYQVLGQLSQLAKTPFAGATGRLSLNSDNRITRQLVCGQFNAGIPAASGYLE